MWVKLGEERVNTDAIERYESNGGLHFVLYMKSRPHDPVSRYDPDGALLRALDQACFPVMVHEMSPYEVADRQAEATAIHRDYTR